MQNKANQRTGFYAIGPPPRKSEIITNFALKGHVTCGYFKEVIFTNIVFQVEGEILGLDKEIRFKRGFYRNFKLALKLLSNDIRYVHIKKKLYVLLIRVISCHIYFLIRNQVRRQIDLFTIKGIVIFESTNLLNIIDKE